MDVLDEASGPICKPVFDTHDGAWVTAPSSHDTLGIKTQT